MPEETISPSLTVLIAPEHATSSQLLGLVRRVAGAVLLVSSPEGFDHLSNEHLSQFFREAKALNSDRKLIIAIKPARCREIALRFGWETVQNIKTLRLLLKGHKQEAEVIRSFSPITWRQDIRSRLQAVGILSLPKVRIWTMLIVSMTVFLFAFFRLLPSSEVRIWPDQESKNFTTNVYLSASGTVLPVPTDRVRVLPLLLSTVSVSRTLTYDKISKNFTGTNAEMTVTIFNDSAEEFSLRKGSRLINQAGVKFRLRNDLILPARSTMDVIADADPIDQYGKVVGERGNVPAGVKWDFPGLTEKEGIVIYGRNEKSASGGVTSYVNLLTKEDVEGTPQHPGAKQLLMQVLLNIAKQQIEDERQSLNKISGSHFVQLNYQDLTKTEFKDFDLSNEFIGQNITTIPVSGSIEYTVILYDENDLLHLLQEEVYDRVPPNKTVVESSLSKENMDLNVIAPWDDDFRWVKITANLTYTERYVINPITPSGARFGKYIRDNVAGKTVSEALRIVRNLPEVDSVEISVWPPWAFTLPTLGNSISVTEKQN